MAKIIVFSPYSLIWIQAFPEAIVAESLKKSGHDVVYITCAGSLNAGCVCLSMQGIHSDSFNDRRAQVCHQCSSRADLIRREMGFTGYALASVEDPEDEGRVKEVMASLSPANFSEFMIDGIAIGRIAAFEFLLDRKKINVDFSESEWQQYRPILKSAIKAFYILKRIFDKEKPDYVLSYNGVYSVNAVCSHLAMGRGIAPYFMHAGGNLSARLSTLMLGRKQMYYYMAGLIKRWPVIKERPCAKSLLFAVTAHFLELLRGRSAFVYSSPKSKNHVDVRRFFGIRPEQKILVATMSSYDEIFAAEFVGIFLRSASLLFATQADWVKALLAWVRARPDYFLIIRVHPREFPNKRESVMSEHARILQALFVNLPKNVMVNWPDDKLSLYDLACEADVVLNSWSSAGKEMALLGIPVVAYNQEMMFYPVDIHYFGESEELYFDQVQRALQDGWSFERMRMAYRWHVMEFGRSIIRIDESYTGTATYKNKVQLKFVNGLRRLYPLIQEWNDCRKRSVRLKCAEVLNQVFIKGAEMPFDVMERGDEVAPSLEQETGYLKIEMARIAKAMWGGIDNAETGQNNKLYQHFKKSLLDESRTISF
ncbi:MAG: hypothetical protein HQL21_08525 [Candidatus Omnitrophica bacterium]|nr:hypothetical protein [Candidatus Omnitrophota bacterium]